MSVIEAVPVADLEKLLDFTPPCECSIDGDFKEGGVRIPPGLCGRPADFRITWVCGGCRVRHTAWVCERCYRFIRIPSAVPTCLVSRSPVTEVRIL